MDHDGYNHPNFPKSQKPTQKIFSFPTSSRPNPELKIPKQSNTSFFSNVSQRNVSNHRNGPGNDQPQLLRIFPPSNSFSTPQRMPKREPTSPADFGEEFHPMTSPNVRLTEDDTRLNGQQKGFKALDSHIIAPSHRYLPTPSEIHRPRSRAVSQTPSLSQESELGDGDDDLSNFVNRMKEAKVVKSQLAEERVLSANLRSQLASTQVKVSELQHRNAGLEKAAGENQGHLQSKNEELSRTRQLLEEAEANQKSQENIISEKDRQLQCSAEQLALVRKRLHESDEKLATIRDAAKKRIEDLCKNFDSAQASFEQLKCRHDKSQQHLQLIRDEILDVKIAAKIEPYLDSTGRHLLKSVETRGLVQELQNDRNDAQQVIDMLRDKLHVLGAQVVEYKEKIDALESLRREEGLNLTKSAGILDDASEKVGQIAARLCKREKEDAELAAEGLKLEVMLTDANERIDRLQKDLLAKEHEVERLLAENRNLKLDVDVKCTKLDDALQMNVVNAEKMESYQAQVRCQEEEITCLKERLNNSMKAAQSSQANLEKVQSSVLELQSELRSSQVVETATRTKLDHAVEKLKNVELGGVKAKKEYEEKLHLSESKLEKLRKECEGNEEELRQATNRFAVLQERFDSQAMMLKLAKEHSGDLQERILLSEKTHATKLEAAEGKYRADIAVMTEQKSMLQAQLDQLHTSFERVQASERTKATELAVMTEQRSALLGDLERLRVTLTKLEAAESKHKTDIALATQATAAGQKQLEALRSTLASLESNVNRHKAEIAVLEEQKTGLQAALDQQTATLSQLKAQSIKLEEGTKAEKVILAEQKLNLQATVDRLQEDYRKLESQCALKDKMLVQQDDVNIKRAVTAETGLECATERIKELQSQLGIMQTTVKDAKKAEAELARLREEEPKMKEAVAKVTELEKEIHRFRQKEGTISERYRQGQLSDPEKQLVDDIIRTTQSMYEHDIVEKENELRSRDNQNNALQAKIDALESALAKLLKKHGENEGQGQSLVDLNIWMSSPLTSQANTQSQQTPALIVTTKASRSPWSATTPPPPAQPRTFAELNNEEEEPISFALASSLGKRSRPSSPVPAPTPPPPMKVAEKEQEPVRPGRKAKGPARKADQDREGSDRKPKSKKRR